MRQGLIVAVLCAISATLGAADGGPVDVGTRARGAAKVVVATVGHVQARFDVNEHGDRVIVTQAWLDVEESLKGGVAQAMPVDVEGGTIGDLTLNVSDMPVLRTGDRAVFFLNAQLSAAGAHRLHRRGLGVMRLNRAGGVQGSALTLQDVRAAVRGGR